MSSNYKYDHFPDRVQNWGFSNRREAIKDARLHLGQKAKINLMFIVMLDRGWGWVNASLDEQNEKLGLRRTI
jgi:hypothetical protein